jgi:hypothetical protein
MLVRPMPVVVSVNLCEEKILSTESLAVCDLSGPKTFRTIKIKINLTPRI